jgi:hypothetical protein
MSRFPLSLMGLRRTCAPMAWAFVILVLTVFVERRVAESDFDEGPGVSLENDEAVEGEEILQKLVAANDVIIPIVETARPLESERPPVAVAAPLSLQIVRGLESRAPPSARSFSS